MTTAKLIEDFLRAYFVEHDADKGLALVTQDIRCYGFAGESELSGVAALRALAAADMQGKLTGAVLEIKKAEQIAQDSAVVHYSLTHNAVSLRGRIVGNSRNTPAGEKLYLMSNTVLNPPQTGAADAAADTSTQIQLQNQFKDLVINMPSAVCLYRWDGERLERLLVGEGFGEIFGRAAKAAVDSSDQMLFKVVHPDDVADLKSHLNRFLQAEGNGTESCGYRAWHEETQAYRWVSLHAKKVLQPDGSYLAYVVYSNDTEQVEMKNQLAATRTAVNAAVQYGQLGLWTYDMATGTITQNLADNGAYGYAENKTYSPEQFIEEKVIHEEDAASYSRCYQEIRDGAQHSECEARVLDIKNGYHWMHIHLVRQPEVKGENPTAIGVSFDIDREVNNYRRLAEAQKQLRQEKQVIDELFENLPGGVVMYRWDGINLDPLYVSKGFSAFYGEDGEGVLRRATGLDFDVVHPDDLPALQAFITENIANTGKTLIYRYRVWNRHLKEYIWLQLTGITKRQPDGTFIAYANYADVNAEVKASEEIHTEEQMLEAASRMAHIWTFRYDVLEKRIYLSKYLQETLELPAVMDNYPESLFDYPTIPAEYHEIYRQMVRKVDAGADATTELQVKMPGGPLRDVRFEWHVTKKKAGKALEVAAFAMDISQEVAERRRFDKERRKMLGADKKLTGYCVIDLNSGILIDAKDNFLGSGIKPGDTCRELGAKSAPFLFEEKDRKHFIEMCNDPNAIFAGKNGEEEHTEDMKWVNAKAHVRWQRSVYTVIENSFSGARYLYCYLYDVMEEKIMQALFSGIQEHLYLKTAVFSFATGQLYTYTGTFPNNSLLISDYEKSCEIYVQNEVLPEEAARMVEQLKMKNLKKELAAHPQVFSFTHRAMADGVLRYRQLLYAPVPGDADVYIIVVRDITDLIESSEKKNAELQKALTAANAAAQAKSEFLSRMSHEIRTPMNAIMGMTAIAQDNKSDFLQVSDCLNKIESSSQYLLTLINDILEMSRIESGNAQLSEDKFDFATLMEGINTVAEPLAQKSNVRLEVVNHTVGGVYYGDRVRIQQIMINLLGNALKFTKKSGRVRFAVSAAEDTETGTTFEFMVEDTGIGMSPEFMQKMFEPFTQEDATTTSRYGGSGLGLAISKSLVDAMGGSITAESMVGIGTSFTVKIPLKKVQNEFLLKDEKAAELSREEADAILKGKRVLMAEDHPMNVMIAKKLLERKGVAITVAENGKIAVETFRNSAPHEYDAILMDIRMPVMDGLAATRQIRALNRPDAATIPIIAMTANALEEDRKNSRAVGMNEHLAKPIEPKRLYQTLAKQIAGGTV